MACGVHEVQWVHEVRAVFVLSRSNSTQILRFMLRYLREMLIFADENNTIDI